MMKTLKRIFELTLYLTVLQQFPIIRNYYNMIRIVIYALFILLTIISIIKIFNKPMLIYNYLLIFLMIYSIFLYFLSGLNSNFNGNILGVFVSFGVYFISYFLDLGEEDLKRIIITYTFLITLLGISIVLYYGGGFDISEQYIFSNKNQVGPLLSYASILSLLFVREKHKFLGVLLTILNLSSLLVIRNRSGILAIIIVIVILFYKEIIRMIKSAKKIIMFIFIFIVFIFLFKNEIFKIRTIVYNSLFANYDIRNFESLSAGRTDLYTQSMFFISENPISGQLFYFDKKITRNPHNYLLYLGVNYGFIIALPFILYYINLWYLSFKNIKETKIIGYILLLSLIVSLFEYSYPYGPGITQIILWVILERNINSEIFNLS